MHFLRLHLVGKKIAKASAQDDANVFGKVGTTGDAVAAALKGSKVVSAGTQGKYFWLVLDKAPHLVMHLGMTGWLHIRNVRTAYTNYYKKQSPDEADLWPPKYWRFHLTAADGTEAAFTDPRRFGRVRLVDCPGPDIRKHSPLVENGPDPVVDTDKFTLAYLAGRLHSRRAPVKALLLDQAVVSGLGNWVADEVLFQARLHPERPAHELDAEEVSRLYAAISDVCRVACDKLADSDLFPGDWLFSYRWGKGAAARPGADVARLPSGEALAFITVGGRTSCYAPALQRKSGDGGDENLEIDESKALGVDKVGQGVRAKKVSPRPPLVKAKVEDGEDRAGRLAKPKPKARKRKEAPDDGDRDELPLKVARSTASQVVTGAMESGQPPRDDAIGDQGRRRSGRIRAKPN